MQWTKQAIHSQVKGLVPFGVEVGADGFGFLLGLIFGVWGEFQLDIWIRQAVGVHRDQVSAFTHWWRDKKKIERNYSFDKRETTELLVTPDDILVWFHLQNEHVIVSCLFLHSFHFFFSANPLWSRTTDATFEATCEHQLNKNQVFHQTSRNP